MIPTFGDGGNLLAEKAKACPHSARDIDFQNPCPCGIRWRYDEGTAAWTPARYDGEDQ